MTQDRILDDNDLEFLQAMDKFKREVKPFPTVTDHLRILKGLGWRKQEQKQEAMINNT